MDESNVVSYTTLVAVRTAKAMKNRREHIQVNHFGRNLT